MLLKQDNVVGPLRADDVVLIVWAKHQGLGNKQNCIATGLGPVPVVDEIEPGSGTEWMGYAESELDVVSERQLIVVGQ